MKNYIFIVITMLLISFSMFAHGNKKDSHNTTESAVAKLAASVTPAAVLTPEQKLAIEKYKLELENYKKKKLLKKSLEKPIILVDFLVLFLALYVITTERIRYRKTL